MKPETKEFLQGVATLAFAGIVMILMAVVLQSCGTGDPTICTEGSLYCSCGDDGCEDGMVCFLGGCVPVEELCPRPHTVPWGIECVCEETFQEHEGGCICMPGGIEPTDPKGKCTCPEGQQWVPENGKEYCREVT